MSKVKIINPVLKGFNPDPSIIKGLDENGRTVFYIACSTFEYFPGVQIHKSYDLINWKLITRPLNTLQFLDMRGNPDSAGVWAPDLSYSDGLYWLVYADVKVTEGCFKDCTNYLTTAKSIFGPWSNPIKLNCSGFDASLFHNTDGKKYLLNVYWDSREYKTQFAGIQCTEFSVKEKKLLPEKSKIIYKGTEAKLVEGPHLYKIKTKTNFYYYLFCAQGGTTYTHQEVVARSKSLNSLFETAPGFTNDKVFLSAYNYPNNYLQKCGHGSLIGINQPINNNFFDITKDDFYFIHLASRPLKYKTQSTTMPRGFCPLGRETAIQRVLWNKNNWPYIKGGQQGAKKIDAPNLTDKTETTNHNQTLNNQKIYFDNFNNGKHSKYALPLHWQTLRIPFTNQLGVYKEKSQETTNSTNLDFGELKLFGKQSLTSLFTQSHILRRWQDRQFTTSVFVDFSPSTYQQQAGLTAYYNTKNWTFFCITNTENNLESISNSQTGKKILEIVTTDNGQQASWLSPNNKAIIVPKKINKIGLKMTVNYNTYDFSYSFDLGKTWKAINLIFDSLKLSDDYISQNYGGFFTGTFTGLACIDLTGFDKQAKFTNFKYETA
ncbi:MAG: glycoside hydrolase family 43 protein [Bifidobacteriaceae bacterium]|nr:glycoside hydrolase family 43 protein [Bifidobacteriaceae bacterium]